ncbi:velvet factor-domain-containing protein [Entophlyctis helioformis]|nr:velvet factor-domain-containing protein [Entophlyctis helioformis]
MSGLSHGSGSDSRVGSAYGLGSRESSWSAQDDRMPPIDYSGNVALDGINPRFPNTSSQQQLQQLHQQRQLQQQDHYRVETPLPPVDYRYEMVVRQQPQRARMCGFSNARDRRLLNPPLILQVTMHDGNNNRHLVSMDRSPYLICHASLWSADGRHHYSAVLNPRSSSATPVAFKEDIESRTAMGPLANERSLNAAGVVITDANSDQFCEVLVGNPISKCSVLFDLDDTQGMFFVFPDLGVRSPGRYTIKCSVIDLDMTNPVFSAVGCVFTNTFEVFSPKNFPGSVESTLLCKAFARQGVLLHVRSDLGTKRGSASHQDEDADDVDAATGASMPRRAGRRKAAQPIERRQSKQAGGPVSGGTSSRIAGLRSADSSGSEAQNPPTRYLPPFSEHGSQQPQFQQQRQQPQHQQRSHPYSQQQQQQQQQSHPSVFYPDPHHYNTPRESSAGSSRYHASGRSHPFSPSHGSN